MTSSEVVRSDHDYFGSLKEELIDVKEEQDEDFLLMDTNINLATLADVSLSTAGQLDDKSLKRKIDLARAKIKKTILPVTPEMSSKRTMQVCR